MLQTGLLPLLMATALFAMAVNFDVTSQSGLRHLDDYLFSRYYITGQQPSLDDVAVYTALGHPPGPDLANVWRWYTHIHALLDNTFPGPAVGVEFTGVGQPEQPHDVATSSGQGSTPVSETISNDVTSVGAFGSNDNGYANGDLESSHEELQHELNTVAEDVEAVRSLGRQRRTRSSIILDVKPWDDETDMVKLEEAVRAVQLPGLQWGASKLVPVVGQIHKLQIEMTIDDDLVSPENLIEENLTAAPVNEHIQSCDIVAWNKLCKFVFIFG